MSTETVLIQANEPKTTKDGKTYHLITAGGKKYSCWESGAAGVKPGESWKVEIEQKGNFWNITKLLSQETTSPGPPNAQQGEPGSRDATALQDHPVKRTSIERQKALDIAERFYSRYATEDGLTMAAHSTRLLLLAGKLAQWVATGEASLAPAEAPTTLRGTKATLRPPGASLGTSTELGEEGPF